MDALVRKRRDVYQRVSSEVLEIPERFTHVSGVVEKFALPGYLEEGYLRTLYDVDRTYDSEVSGRKQQYQDERKWWENHKLLSRAEKFATGSVAETLQREKQHLFAQLNERIKQAEQADAKNIAEMEQEYDAFLIETDAQAEKLYRDALARREEDYQTWLEQAKTETEPKYLMDLAKAFGSLHGYKDSKNLAEHCRKRAEEEQDKLDEAEARRRILAEQKKVEKKKKATRLAITSIVAAAVVSAAALLVTKVIIPSSKYKAAEELLASGQYRDAIDAFTALEGYKDSDIRIAEIHYTQAEEFLEKGETEKAIAEFDALGQYNDSRERVQKIYYGMGEKFVASGESVHAAMAFGAAGDYLDAWERSSSYWNDIAQREVLGSGFSNAVALREDGTVVCVGETDDEMREARTWEKLIAISDKTGSPVGLKADGTVTNISDWKGIVAISSGYSCVFGLKADGTVSVAGYKSEAYTNVVAQWSDIIAISAGDEHVVALKSDGTVVAAGSSNQYGQCNVSGWRDIVAVAAGDEITLGLKSDGTVVSTGSVDLSKWEDIVAVSAGSSHALGLKADGTVLSVEIGYYSSDADPFDVSEWKDIVAVHIGWDFALGLKSDGTVVKTGSFLYKNVSTNVSGWKNIKQPTMMGYQNNIKNNYASDVENAYQQAVAAIEENDLLTARKLLTDIRGYKDSEQKIGAMKDSYQEVLKDAQIGDSIYFGTYEQDGKSDNGKEDIEWIVLQRTEEELLAISRYILDNVDFYGDNKSDTIIMRWLNNFKKAAFSESESAMCAYTTLLTVDEARSLLANSTAKTTEATPYAQREYGVYAWWLRSYVGEYNVYCVDADTGSIDQHAGYLAGGARPVVGISISQSVEK